MKKTSINCRLFVKNLAKAFTGVCIIASMGVNVDAKAPVYEEPVIKLKHGQGSEYDYIPNEVIVKFKDTSGVRVMFGNNRTFRTTSVKSINTKLAALGVMEAEPLMPLTGAKKLRKGNIQAKSLYGKTIEEPDMSRLYLFRIDESKKLSMDSVLVALRSVKEVEYAEPNYRVYSLVETTHHHHHDDPLNTEQYDHSAINMPALWEVEPITDKRPVIAIIDTGVDITHPDLANNIWVNTKEVEGTELEDDDANGFVDDVHGWDFVDKTPIMTDPNGHGTHCAGIAAAEGDNQIGITGANPDALIMPIRVMEPDGVGSTSVIIKGIDYATANGADVLSMSFGGNRSSALYDALKKAYQNAILVGAAGNNGQSIYRPGGLIFPGGYDIVLGVQASNKQGERCSFSNYDPDGPYYVNTDWFSEYWNYEILAPGEKVMSTYPSGKYKKLSGTSMATPLVAGAISRLLQTKPAELYRDTWIGDMIAAKNAETGVFDAYQAYSYNEDNRQVRLSLLKVEVCDSVSGDGDGDLDAGEIVELYPTLRSEWGHALNVKVSVEVDSRYESASSIEVLDTNVDFGYSLNSRGIGKATNPVRIKINPDLKDSHNLKLILRATCDNIAEELTHEVDFNVVNGVEIGGMITENTTLYPDVHYIVTKNLMVSDDVTLTIKPGTVLKFKGGSGITLAKNANLECTGNPDSLITFTMADGDLGKIGSFKGSELPKYNTTIIDGETYYLTYYKTKIKYVLFNNITGSQYLYSYFNIENCVFIHNYSNVLFRCSNIAKCNIISNCFYNYIISNNSDLLICNYNNIINNYSRLSAVTGIYEISKKRDFLCYQNSNIFTNYDHNLENQINLYPKISSVTLLVDSTNYYGSSREDIARIGIWDIENPFSPESNVFVDLSNMRTRPSAEAHGIVWKVVVNGYDAQDEYEQLPPLGVGRHKFEVYFNRPMNTAVAPTIAMGAQEPYNQIPIEEDGTWSADSLVYTAYLTVDGKMNADGVNRIYVAGAEDNEYFEIPVEDMRFNVNVQSAGSMATNFFAEAGLGKVNLTWETDEEDFEDLLGYNIIRYTEHVDSIYEKDYSKYGDYKEHLIVKGDTTIVNKTLIDSQDQSFTDYDVVPGTTYYYYIQQMTTSLTSHNLSNVVASTPLTASKGDANGSMSVDVADIVTQVAYITKQNPQPFIFEAADVNSDLSVNVLDIVGTVSIIKNPGGAAAAASTCSPAVYTIEDGILYVESAVALGGIQFRFNVSEGAEITPLEALNGFETVSDNQGDAGYLFMAFSMTGKTLSTGKHALLRIGDARITEVVLCDATGKSVVGIDGNTSGVGAIEAMQMELPYPNPFNDVLTVPYKVGKDGMHEVKIVISSVTGATVAIHSEKADYGYHTWTWNAGKDVAAGVYFVSLYVDGKLMQTAKAVKR